jgi:hypothetical protein
VTFGSFNRIAKIQDPVVRSWAEILRALPEAMLVIKSDQWSADSDRHAEIEQLFADEGVAEGRVEFRGSSGRAEHFAAYREIDIALDPFPHGGGMTTLDAVWMGVPVITRPGRTIPSRLAAASLSALWLTISSLRVTARLCRPRCCHRRRYQRMYVAYLRLTLRSMAIQLSATPIQPRVVEPAFIAMWREWCVNRQPLRLSSNQR